MNTSLISQEHSGHNTDTHPRVRLVSNSLLAPVLHQRAVRPTLIKAVSTSLQPLTHTCYIHCTSFSLTFTISTTSMQKVEACLFLFLQKVRFQTIDLHAVWGGKKPHPSQVTLTIPTSSLLRSFARLRLLAHNCRIQT